MPTKRTHKKIPARKKTAARPAGTTDPRPLVEGEGRRKEGAVMGADVGKDALDYCIVTGEDILARGQRPNAKDSIEDIISIARKRHVVSVGVESTGTYHWKLVYALVDAGIPVLLANPRQTKNVQGKKTDPLDGLRIAAAHRDGRLLPSVVPARDVVEVRRAT
ncbi:MAG TPA: transposase, partial [Candidatus Lokiarchaeia archaeon]|nr:transposase [Candidatus Lokiarchaeia archaeon]